MVPSVMGQRQSHIRLATYCRITMYCHVMNLETPITAPDKYAIYGTVQRQSPGRDVSCTPDIMAGDVNGKEEGDTVQGSARE